MLVRALCVALLLIGMTSQPRSPCCGPHSACCKARHGLCPVLPTSGCRVTSNDLQAGVVSHSPDLLPMLAANGPVIALGVPAASRKAEAIPRLHPPPLPLEPPLRIWSSL